LRHTERLSATTSWTSCTCWPKGSRERKFRISTQRRWAEGVAEILSRMIPLLRDLGVDAYWDVIKGDEKFFTVTKDMHNALHGLNIDIPKPDLDYFLEVNRRNSEELDLFGDIMFIHDPQPIGLVEKKEHKSNKWIWRCHIDLSAPQEATMNFLRGFIDRYDAAVFSAPGFARSDLATKQILIPPSIDPLSERIGIFQKRP